VANSTEFADMMYFAVDNADTLKNKKESLKLGYNKFTSLSERKFNEMTYVIDRLVRLSRDYYNRLTGKNIPFLSVAHDIWDSNISPFLGISLFFVDPVNWQMVSFPIGMRKSKGKKSNIITNEIRNTLER
jgi:hypothetical protein